MVLPIYVIQAFTKDARYGNAAGVCLIGREKPPAYEKLQEVAKAMNYSETAFAAPVDKDTVETAKQFTLRWFTPFVEVPLCGHATLATAYVIFHIFGNSNSEIYFQTKSGTLACRKGEDQRIIMDFPLWSFAKVDTSADPWATIVTESVHGLAVEEAVFCAESKKLAICLDSKTSRKSLEDLKPDLALLHKQFPSGPGETVRGIMITVASEKGSSGTGPLAVIASAIKGGTTDADFYSRYFAPWVGIDEDPVTGSAHCLLGPYWSVKLGGRKELHAVQCSSSPGDLYLKIRDDGRLDIAGNAVQRELRMLHYPTL